MSVTMQDAINIVRELTEAVARAANAHLPEDDAVAAFEAGNSFLIDAGHEPVDAAAIDYDEDDEEIENDDRLD